MSPLLAVLEFNDYAIIAGIVIVFAGGAAYTARPAINLLKLELQMRDLQQKVDALLKHQGVVMPVPPPSDLSPQVELLARDPSQKIAAIKAYREEHPGVGLAEAKLKIEEFYKSRL
jgi:ribosomal protein L7/L12